MIPKLATTEKVRTGPVQFGSDPPGIFIGAEHAQTSLLPLLEGIERYARVIWEGETGIGRQVDAQTFIAYIKTASQA